MVLQAAAASLVAFLRSPWIALCGVAALLVVWVAALAAESYWLRPRRLGRVLRAQGLGGTAYRFPAGDSAENAKQSQEALSKPLPPSCHDVVPRVMPHLHNTVRQHGEVCVTWDGPDPKVVIAKPELLAEILSSNSGHFEKLRTNLGDLVCRGVGTYDGEKWATHRRILNPAFHLEKLKVTSTRSGCFGGNPRSGSTGSDDDDAFDVVFPPEGIVLKHVLAGGDRRRSGVTSTARPTADHGGMALRSFDDGRVWMDTCRMVALSDVVVASTASQARSMGQLLLWRWTGGRRRRQTLRVRRSGMGPSPGVWLGWAIRL